MGMSASQARLLSITSRMNDIEFKSQQVANTKIRLADDSERVANDYTKALNKQKLTFTSYTTGRAQKTNLTINTLTQAGLQLVSRSGKQFVDKNTYNALKAAAVASTSPTSWANRAVATEQGRANDIYYTFMEHIYGFNSVQQQYASYGLNWNDYEYLDQGGPYEILVNLGKLTREDVDAKTTLFYNLIEGAPQVEAKTADGRDVMGFTTGNVVYLDEQTRNNPNWLYEALESGEFMLISLTTGKEVSVSSEIALAQETDTTELAKAEAKYNAETAKINKKEKILDNEMKALDTEHNALKTEFDSVKSLIGDNVSKSFNLFS